MHVDMRDKAIFVRRVGGQYATSAGFTMHWWATLINAQQRVAHPYSPNKAARYAKLPLRKLNEAKKSTRNRVISSPEKIRNKYGKYTQLFGTYRLSCLFLL